MSKPTSALFLLVVLLLVGFHVGPTYVIYGGSQQPVSVSSSLVPSVSSAPLVSSSAFPVSVSAKSVGHEQTDDVSTEDHVERTVKEWAVGKVAHARKASSEKVPSSRKRAKGAPVKTSSQEVKNIQIRVEACARENWQRISEFSW